MRIKPKVYAAVLAIASAALRHGGRERPWRGKQSLRLVATELQSEFLDLGAPGPSLGDELVFSESLARTAATSA